jgi:MarR family 2-MHQ and catechol resistance regulon transcriptional repressor
MKTDKTELALKTWVKLARAFNTFNKLSNEEISTHGLTPSQFGVLEALFHLGPMTIGKLCEKILATGGNMTVILDNLEKQDLVERIRLKTDRRALCIQLSNKGEELIKQIFPQHEMFIEKQMSVLNENEQIELSNLLKKLGKNLINK